MFVLIPLAIYKSKVLDVLRLGDPIAIGVGVQIEKERRLLLLISVVAGVCVSVGGGLTFLGLIAPHIARKLVGRDMQNYCH
nr:iron chelate uptake ABC transporter family permease subunit [Peribacillus simplex]